MAKTAAPTGEQCCQAIGVVLSLLDCGTAKVAARYWQAKQSYGDEEWLLDDSEKVLDHHPGPEEGEAVHSQQCV